MISAYCGNSLRATCRQQAKLNQSREEGGEASHLNSCFLSNRSHRHQEVHHPQARTGSFVQKEVVACCTV
ncbi:hypothetical protein GN956_G12919 [Arapaima gigas]